ncbi:hypothetical protein LTR36_002479 [Oleoguttula mirabilis]|uniref:Arrestin C-terminal-like domain-containing protein n=1 Tax=Oleoguttula mirabilis TaxID=1507867 RepID=A0AAV9JKW3_9PEZI|nr:hypothetical protein LTR36_002479 [Oleoguttula mirabilis]
MPLGEIQARVVLNHPDRTHYGPCDPVTGSVHLKYYPRRYVGPDDRVNHPEQSTLFGPLKLDLLFLGRVSGIVSEATNSGTIHRDEMLVTKTIQALHDGPFNATSYEVVRIPFRFTFPAHADPKTRVGGTVDDTGSWKCIGRKESDSDEELPPSFSMKFAGHGGLVVEYWLEPKLQMPGIDVKFQVLGSKQKIRYDQSRISQALPSGETLMSSQISTQSPDFMSEAARPQGFRGKTKAMFTSTEQAPYCFDIFCTGIPQHICLGQIFAIEVALRTSNKQLTAHVDPEVLLDLCKFELVARTSIQIDQRRASSNPATDTQVVHTMLGDPTPSGPFTKAHNYTKLVRTEPLVGVPASFAVGKLSRTYRLRVELQFRVAGQTRHARQEIPITIHPPMVRATESTEAGSSRAGAALAFDEEQLPAYEEAVAGAAPPGMDDGEPEVIRKELR